MNINQIQRAKLLLAQAMSASSGTNDSSVHEAQRHMQRAITQLEQVEKKHDKKLSSKETEYQKWWGNVQSGIAAHPMDATAQNRTLAQLNKMIAVEQQKLDKLEKASDMTDLDIVDELLRD